MLSIRQFNFLENIMNYRCLIMLGVLTLLVSSCSSYDDYETSQLSFESIGEVESPYSMETMKQAYRLVTRNLTRSYAVDSENILPTHRYVRFMPTSRHQVDALNDHFTLYTFPLDYLPELQSNTSNEIFSHDGSLYAMIEYNAILPDSIVYDELGVFHNPYEAADIDQDLAGEITRVAYSLVNGGDASKSQVITSWRPSGVVQVWDDFTCDYVPLEGLQLYITHPPIAVPYAVETDLNGYFEGNLTFSDNITYIIQWKGDEWAIKFDGMVPAITVSTSSREPLSLQISKSDSAAYNAATVYRAATFYWNLAYDCTPPTMSETVKITCHGENHGQNGVVGKFHPDYYVDESIIEIWCKNRASHDIISTTLHELAHAVHYSAVDDGTYYRSTSRVIRESWAKFIQNKLVDRLYQYLSSSTQLDYTYFLHDELLYLYDGYQYFIEYSPDVYNIQNWYYNRVYELNIYSPLFIDISDGLNQREWYRDLGVDNLEDYPNDKIRVMGGIPFIEDLVFNNQTLAGIKSDLLLHIAEYELNMSVDDVNELFEVYEQI